MPLRQFSRIFGPSKARAVWKMYLNASSAEQRALEKKAFVFVLQCGFVAHVVNEHLVSVTVMSGPSMFPTFQSGDVVVLDHISPVVNNIKSGDVVVSKGITNPRIQVCKRVGGMAGDVVTVNLPTSLMGAAGIRQRTFKVPKGHIWLEGDNVLNSQDSRHYGPVPYALIVGKAWLQIWPPHRAGLVDHRRMQHF